MLPKLTLEFELISVHQRPKIVTSAMISSDYISAFTSKKLERTLLFVMALIVVAKIVLKLSMPSSSVDEAWYSAAPDNTKIQHAGK